jgi:DNA-binding MarR family transcriptional regulator
MSAPLAVAQLTSTEQLAAVIQPVRRRVLAEIVEPASASEVARRLRIKPQLATYHLRALEDVGLAREVEVIRKRNLTERRFQALARSYVLSTALPLTAEQRRRLASSLSLQALVGSADALRAEALQLLESAAEEVAAAAIELDVELDEEADRAAFVRALTEALAVAAEPYRRRPGQRTVTYRTRLAVNPVPEG